MPSVKPAIDVQAQPIQQLKREGFQWPDELYTHTGGLIKNCHSVWNHCGVIMKLLSDKHLQTVDVCVVFFCLFLPMAYLLLMKKSKKRKVWVKDWLQKKVKLSHLSLMNELKWESNGWFNYLRMNEGTFHDLHVVTDVSPEGKHVYENIHHAL